jgi:hypothetical protein
MLIESGNQEAARLNDILVRLLTTSEFIPVTVDVLRSALQAQERLGLKAQDSIIYASIVAHAAAAAGAKCLIERDAKDFLTPDILEELRALNCTVVSSFTNGLAHIRAALT